MEEIHHRSGNGRAFDDGESQHHKRVRHVDDQVVVLRSRHDMTNFSRGDFGGSLTIAFQLSINEIHCFLHVSGILSDLRVLHVVPPPDQCEVEHTLRFVLHHKWLFPALEELVICNHAISILQLSEAHFPRLRRVRISNPGMPIEVFQICCPQTLEELVVEYATVDDGYGLGLSMSREANPRLRVATAVGTTRILLHGVV